MIRNEYPVCDKIIWTDIFNPTKEEMEEISKEFHLDEHIVRDCLQPEHLPKYELVEDVHFLILRFYAPEADKPIPTIQELTNKIAIFYNEKFIITIHKEQIPFLDDIHKKYIEIKKCSSITELVVKLIWYALETFDDPAESLSDKVDSYESEIMMQKTNADQVQALYLIKHEASVAHKVLLLMAEPINHQVPLKAERPVVQDMHDQYLKMLTLFNQLLDDVNNLMNLSMSFSARRTNEVMRVLTVFSVFFMPLTFIVGIYGMNFKFMPELDKKWGYPAVMIFMALVTVVIYFWFKKKRWL
ncbi:MAG: CorA family divalent cation transporter [Ginsengibacter sp.]